MIDFKKIYKYQHYSDNLVVLSRHPPPGIFPWRDLSLFLGLWAPVKKKVLYHSQLDLSTLKPVACHFRFYLSIVTLLAKVFYLDLEISV